VSRIPQLEQAIIEAATRRVHHTRHRRGRGGLLAVSAISVVLVIVAGAGAATGVLPVGSVVPTPSETQGDGLRYSTNRLVVASGDTPYHGRWEMTIAESNFGSCLGLRFLERPPGAEVDDLSEGCGPDASLDASSLYGGSGPGQKERVVFGRAPEEAVAVRLEAGGGLRRTVATHEGPSELHGDFYLLTTPVEIENALVHWVDRSGKADGIGVDVPGTIEYTGRDHRSDPPH
jgi:hypothetical protein